MKIRAACLLLALLPLGAPAADGVPELSYFEPVDSISDLCSTPYYLLVDHVTAGLPADRTGLRVDDRIVGIDGLRVRDFNEYCLVRYYHETDPTLPLTVIRSGKRIPMEITRPRAVRRGGFNMSGQEPDFLAALRQAGIVPERKSRLPASVQAATEAKRFIEGLFDTFGVQRPTYVGQIESVLGLFPARGRAAIVRLLATGDSDARKGVQNLLDVYLDLRFEQYDTATARIARTGLTDKKLDPFLSDLLAFYQRLALEPPLTREGIPWDVYGVDIYFFSVCFPYPVMPETVKPNFEPEFQEWFDLLTLGGPVHTPKLKNQARTCMRETGGFVGQVQAAILDGSSQGGWPYRSYLVWEPKARRKTMAMLHKRWENRPHDRVLTAIAMLGPAVLDNDVDTFAKAYAEIVKAGPRERAVANRITYSAYYYRGRKERIIERVRRFDRENGIPQVYLLLDQMSPAFKNRLDRGYHYRLTPTNEDLPFWIARNLTVPAVALTRSARAEQIEQLLADPDPERNRFGFELAKHDLAHRPDAEKLDRFLNAARAQDPLAALDALIYAFSFMPDNRWRSFKSAAVFNNYLIDLEDLHYRNLVAELNAIPDQNPDLPAAIQALAPKAGTPSMCLLLAAKLKAAGETDEAAYYEGKAADFYHGLDKVERRKNQVNLRALRDFAALPGFEENAQRYYDRIKKRNWAAVHLLGAILEARKGNKRGVLENITKSAAGKFPFYDSLYIYNREMYHGVENCRFAFLQDLMAAKMLSKRDLAKLRQLKDLDLPEQTANLQPVQLPHAATPAPVATGGAPREITDPFAPYVWIVARDTGLSCRHKQPGRAAPAMRALQELAAQHCTVTALVPGAARIWVGTDRGLFVIPRSDYRTAAAFAIKDAPANAPVHALERWGNTLSITYGAARKKASYDLAGKRWH